MDSHDGIFIADLKRFALILAWSVHRSFKVMCNIMQWEYK